MKGILPVLIARSNASFRVVRWIARRGVLRPRDNVHVPWGGRDRVAGSSSVGGSSNPWSQLPVPRAGRKGHAVTGGSTVGLSCGAPAAAGSEVHADANHPAGRCWIGESQRGATCIVACLFASQRTQGTRLDTGRHRPPACLRLHAPAGSKFMRWSRFLGGVVGSGRVGGRRCLTLVAVPTRAGRKGPRMAHV